jgi:hypothetical protein
MLIALTFPLIAVAAGANEDAIVAIPADCRLVSAQFCPIATSAANGTNYATLTLSKSDGAGGSFTAIADAITTETDALTVGTVYDFALTVADVALGGSVKLAKTFAASGVAVEGNVTLLLEKVAI